MSSVLDALRKAEGGADPEGAAQAQTSAPSREATAVDQGRASGGSELPGGGSFDGPPDGGGPDEPGGRERKNPGALAVIAVALVGLGLGYLVSSMLIGGSGDPETIELAERAEKTEPEVGNRDLQNEPREQDEQEEQASSSASPASRAVARESHPPSSSDAKGPSAPVLAEGKRARRERQPGREDVRSAKQAAADEKSAGAPKRPPATGSESAPAPAPAAVPKATAGPRSPEGPNDPVAPGVADSKRPASAAGRAVQAENRKSAEPGGVWPGYKTGSTAQKPPSAKPPVTWPEAAPDKPSSPADAPAPAKAAAPKPNQPATPAAPVTPAAPAAPAEPEISPVAPTGAPEIALLFIKWSSDPVYRVASMRGPGGKLLIVKEGDIVEGMKVSSIERGAVIMQWRGNLFRLAAGRSAS